MSWGACTPRTRAPSWRMLLAGLLLYLHFTVQCQAQSTVVVHDSSELASALRNASMASQTSPISTVILLKQYSWEVSCFFSWPLPPALAVLCSPSVLHETAEILPLAGFTERRLLCRGPERLLGKHHHQPLARAEGHYRLW